MKTVLTRAATAACVLLAGCGVTLEASRVSRGQVPAFVPGEGVVFALPKTELLVQQPVKLVQQTAGVLADIYDGCKRTCEAGGSADEQKAACSFDLNSEVRFGTPSLSTVAAPDASRLYQVRPSADLFQSMDYKFEVASSGVADKIDTKLTNNTYEVVAAVVETVAKAAGAAVKDSPARQKIRKLPRCYATSMDVQKLAKAREGQAQCGVVLAVRDCLASFDTAIEAERGALDKLFGAAASGKPDPKILDARAAHQKERIAAAVAAKDDALGLYGLQPGKPKEGLFQLVLPLPAVVEFENYSNSVTLAASVANGHARVAPLSDTAPAMYPALVATLQKDSRTYKATANVPSHVLTVGKDQPEPPGGGYRYRIPMPSATTLTVLAANGTTTLAGPFAEQKVIAQYGPVAALPSRFNGKSGRVMVKYWPEHGGLQTVEIGSEAVPATAVTKTVDQLFDNYKTRKEKAEEAASADTELDALTRQQKILALQKQIKDLEAELKK